MVAVAAPPKGMTAAEFYEFAHRPENAGRWWELDQGKVIEVPPPRPQHGTVCGWVAYHLWSYAIRRGRGRVTTNDTGLIVEENPDTVRGVDVMFFDESVPLAQIPRQYALAIPSLVVEVWSPSDRRNQMNRRVAQYMARGVPLLWLVDPDDQSVAVHRPGQLPIIAERDGELTGYDILPELRLTVADLFTLPGQQPPPPPTA